MKTIIFILAAVSVLAGCATTPAPFNHSTNTFKLHETTCAQVIAAAGRPVGNYPNSAVEADATLITYPLPKEQSKREKWQSYLCSKNDVLIEKGPF